MRAAQIAKPVAERRARGAYFTPDALALAIAQSLRGVLPVPTTILEPGCGGGAFLRAANATWPAAALWGVDTEPACDGPGAVVRMDLDAVQAQRDLVLGNPDFLVAERVVRHCLGLLTARGHLAFLLPLSFLGGTGRRALFEAHPLRYLQPISGRPSFTRQGTGSQEYAVFVWQQGHTGRGEILQPLVWR